MKEALLWLERNPVPVVICSRDLTDGSWHTFLQRVRRQWAANSDNSAVRASVAHPNPPAA